MNDALLHRTQCKSKAAKENCPHAGHDKSQHPRHKHETVHSLLDAFTCKEASQQQGCATHRGQVPQAEGDPSSQALGPAGSHAVDVAPEVFTACNVVLLGAIENVAWRMTGSRTGDRQVTEWTGCCACMQQGRCTSSCMSAHLLWGVACRDWLGAILPIGGDALQKLRLVRHDKAAAKCESLAG